MAGWTAASSGRATGTGAESTGEATAEIGPATMNPATMIAGNTSLRTVAMKAFWSCGVCGQESTSGTAPFISKLWAKWRMGEVPLGMSANEDGRRSRLVLARIYRLWRAGNILRPA